MTTSDVELPEPELEGEDTSEGALVLDLISAGMTLSEAVRLLDRQSGEAN